MGDFNAEPEEVAIRYLLEKENFNSANSATSPDCPSSGEAETTSTSTLPTAPCGGPQYAPFVDAWQYVHSKRTSTLSGTIAEEKTGVELVQDQGLTFPACNPVKRIDFILVRNASVPLVADASARVNVHADIRGFSIEGVRPTADTGTLFTFVCTEIP